MTTPLDAERDAYAHAKAARHVWRLAQRALERGDAANAWTMHNVAWQRWLKARDALHRAMDIASGDEPFGEESL